ncbi:MAG: hypothetical protein DVS81_05055 [Candidatus Accumulibacter meliphilus]|uniref:Uncharacterized protein n=1 Tax=Candidatus Accumulibacter meliphilus TaxID=2211374 RepID=A0A369XQ66_9PROT|nr:MAG: hypothetical protein DVS81_05055 [Candidatus Accumulibacter meliphilus]
MREKGRGKSGTVMTFIIRGISTVMTVRQAPSALRATATAAATARPHDSLCASLTFQSGVSFQ